jgi:hypothetical protein
VQFKHYFEQRGVRCGQYLSLDPTWPILFQAKDKQTNEMVKAACVSGVNSASCFSNPFGMVVENPPPDALEQTSVVQGKS